MPVMQVHQFVRERETEAETGIPGRQRRQPLTTRIEYDRQQVTGDTGTGVVDDQLAERNAAGRPHHDTSAAGGELDRVIEQRAENLF